MKMIPGMNKFNSDQLKQERNPISKRCEAMIKSMTTKERKDPISRQVQWVGGGGLRADRYKESDVAKLVIFKNANDDAANGSRWHSWNARNVCKSRQSAIVGNRPALLAVGG